jgi:hypothetical protein
MASTAHTVLRVTAESPTPYSISVRLRRVTTEEAYVSVPVDRGIVRDAPDADGSLRIDTDKLWSEAIRLAVQSDRWSVEGRQVTPHPIRKAPPGVADQPSPDEQVD